LMWVKVGAPCAVRIALSQSIVKQISWLAAFA
jgi:hypothetical protein